MSEHPALKYARLSALHEAHRLETELLAFMRTNHIQNPRDVTAVYMQNPGLGARFVRFEVKEFNDNGANI